MRIFLNEPVNGRKRPVHGLVLDSDESGTKCTMRWEIKLISIILIAGCVLSSILLALIARQRANFVCRHAATKLRKFRVTISLCVRNGSVFFHFLLPLYNRIPALNRFVGSLKQNASV